MGDILGPVGEYIGKGLACSMLFKKVVFLLFGVLGLTSYYFFARKRLVKKPKFVKYIVVFSFFIVFGLIGALLVPYKYTYLVSYIDPSCSIYFD